MRLIKIHDALMSEREYIPTTVDEQKTKVDFLIMQVGPYVIKWQNGNIQTVTERKLKTLQKSYTWATDF